MEEIPENCVVPEFEYKKANEEQVERMNRLRVKYSELMMLIRNSAPPCRSLSVACTELETSAMWAMKAVTHG